MNIYKYNATYDMEGMRVSLKQWCIEYILIGNQMLENIQNAKKPSIRIVWGCI